jgi:hypothetical protein
MRKKWDQNDHQGKSKISVELSYRILFVCVMIFTIAITWGLVYKLIKWIF